jgi:hypothetical protein
MAHSAFVASGSPKLEAQGFLLSVCKEEEIDTVADLSPQEKNALKMVVRQRQAGNLASLCHIHAIVHLHL